MSTKEQLQKLREFLKLSETPEKVELATMTLANGTVLEAESFEAGQSVFIVSDEENVALPVGEYELEDGQVLTVSEEGVIGEIKEKPAEEVSDEVEAEAEMVSREEFDSLLEIVNELVSKVSQLQPEEAPVEASEESEQEQETNLESEDKEEVELEDATFKHSPEKINKKTLNLTKAQSNDTLSRVSKMLFG
jgi:hypothetical protein